MRASAARVLPDKEISAMLEVHAVLVFSLSGHSPSDPMPVPGPGWWLMSDTFICCRSPSQGLQVVRAEAPRCSQPSRG